MVTVPVSASQPAAPGVAMITVAGITGAAGSGSRAHHHVGGALRTGDHTMSRGPGSQHPGAGRGVRAHGGDVARTPCSTPGSWN